MPRRHTVDARMNMSPPMIGVPFLFLCQEGPISRMEAPAFSAWSIGSSSCPNAQDSAPPTTAVIRIRVMNNFLRLWKL